VRFLKDSQCSPNTPVVHGAVEKPIYGRGVCIQADTPGKTQTEYDRKVYLGELLPLEEYDHIIVLFSGGKDSAAAYFRLLEMGVPKSKIELWHHDSTTRS